MARPLRKKLDAHSSSNPRHSNKTNLELASRAARRLLESTQEINRLRQNQTTDSNQ